MLPFAGSQVGSNFVDDTNIRWETTDRPATAEDYIFREGRRLVRPYFFEFLAHVKRRWAGKNIVDLFSHEFRQRPAQYYVEAVESGRIRVGGQRVTISYVVRDSQQVSHFVHRHEPPVMAEPVTVLEEGPDVLVVCKPASVPVHACGQYRKNTVIGILQAEHKAGPLYPIHRLDRLVSGLLIFARNAHTADLFREEIEAGRVKKEYIAKVLGVFPESEEEVNAPVLYDTREGLSTVEQAPEEGGGQGKDSCTRFLRLSTNGKYSIVKCMPLTGRTHQIRVHLQYLGHPIANDALYLHKSVAWRSREATTADQAAARVADGPLRCRPSIATGTTSASGHIQEKPEADLKAECSKAGGEAKQDAGDAHLFARSSVAEFTADPLCTHCPNWEPAGYEEDVVGIWLHCVKYSCEKWSYECPLPDWARLSGTSE